VLAFAEEDGEAEEEPVEAQLEEGRFELLLARGRHTLYALAPDCAASFAAELADSTVPSVELAVARTVPVQARVGLRADDGSVLAHAEVELALRLAPGRTARWKALVSDAHGVLGYAHAADAEVVLSVRHVVLGSAPRTYAPGDPLLARASLLRVDGAARFASLRLGDGNGRWLQTEGPLGREDSVGLLDGASAVFAVPSEARFAEFVGPFGELLRLPLAPRPGEVVTLTP
jgi:hypothetical protein